jgi:hypothetical protein
LQSLPRSVGSFPRHFSFEAASELKVNLAKLVLILVSNVQQVDSLAGILGCEVSTLPVEYLGIPLGAPHNVTHIWNRVIEKIERRMAGWKWSLLSKGGRVTLIKSTLANIPMYYMSLYKLPVRVANRIEKLQCDFLWGGLGEEFKYYLVVQGMLSDYSRQAWHKKVGGFQLGFIRQMVVVEAKYGSIWGGWCPCIHRGVLGVSLWNICLGWKIFSRHIRLVIGDETRVRFWHDRWCGDTNLFFDK